MRTRIISGIVLVLLLALVLFAGSFFPPVITAFLAVLCVIALYELLHNAFGIRPRLPLIAAGVYAVVSVFVLGGYTLPLPKGLDPFTVATVLYATFSAVLILGYHKRFELKQIAALISMPIVLCFAFGCLEKILNRENSLYYLLLLLNYSSICDMGAYFAGTAFGKHKLCPGISPKKTVEGAIGGVAASLLVTVVLCLIFRKTMIVPLVVTLPLCVLGMVGDLFASAIKRAAGIKDYGKLIPGHGGVLDRLDSILMLAPCVALLILAGVLA